MSESADSVYSYASGDNVRIESPTFIANDVPAKFREVVGNWTIPQPFVAEIEDGCIVKDFGIGATADRALILDTASSREGKLQSCFSEYRRPALELLLRQRTVSRNSVDSPDIDVGVSLIRSPYLMHSKGYSHWIQSHLTLLQGIEHYEEHTGVRPKVILEPDPSSWITQSLRFFGISSDDVVHWTPDRELTVDQLIVPSVRRIEQTMDEKYDKHPNSSIYKLLSPSACNWLRDSARHRVNNTLADKFSRKVYISRTDADRRELDNRAELLDVLEPRGFESYELTALSFEEQVSLFANAEKVVALHGAGLANTMFSQDCQIVEIFGKTIKPTYFLQSSLLDLEYRGVLGEPADDDAQLYKEDVYVEPDQVLNAL